MVKRQDLHCIVCGCMVKSISNFISCAGRAWLRCRTSVVVPLMPWIPAGQSVPYSLLPHPVESLSLLALRPHAAGQVLSNSQPLIHLSMAIRYLVGIYHSIYMHISTALGHNTARSTAGIVASMTDTRITAFGFVMSKILSETTAKVTVAKLAGHTSVQPKQEIALIFDNSKV